MRFIYTIEVSCLCNLQCAYCPHAKSARKKGLMSMAVFEKSMELVKALGQNEVCLHNFGEPLIHPRITDLVKRARQTVAKVVFSTNGLLLTRELAVALKDSGLTELYISSHAPADAPRAIRTCEGLDLLKNVGTVFWHDWAGTAERHPTHYQDRRLRKTNTCKMIADGWAVILWDGRVNSCCMDMEGLGVIGTVFDPDILRREPTTTRLCENCHYFYERASLRS
ncbi:MAG: radical SAM protein [Lentisphaerae bacterium]|nr:radical SAM protein [Lentisphaerota bacterium]